MSNDSNNSVLAVVLAFFTGGLIGSALAVLLTPFSGRETRERIVESTIDTIEIQKLMTSEIDSPNFFLSVFMGWLVRALSEGNLSINLNGNAFVNPFAFFIYLIPRKEIGKYH